MVLEAQWLINYRIEFRINNRVVNFFNLTQGQTLTYDRLNAAARNPRLPTARFLRWRLVNNPPPGTVTTWDGVTPLLATVENFGPARPNAPNTPIIFEVVWDPNPRVSLIQDHLDRVDTNYTFEYPLDSGHFYLRFPPDPLRMGYIFSGWYNCSGRDLFGNPLPPDSPRTRFDGNSRFTENTTLFARWEPAALTVNFVVNYDNNRLTNGVPAHFGGTVNPPIMRNPADNEIIRIASWHRNPNFSDAPINFGTFVITQNITLYGRPIEDGETVYVIFINPWGQELGRVAVEYGSTITRQQAPSVPPDSRFIFQNNWFQGMSYVPDQTAFADPGLYSGLPGMYWEFAGYMGTSALPVTTTTYLLASVAHRVTFDNGIHYGGVRRVNRLYARGDTISLPVPERDDGYSFMGWYTQPNGGGALWDVNDQIWRHVTLYANWVFDGDLPQAFTPFTSLPPGIYPAGVWTVLGTIQVQMGGQVRFTTDGSEPTRHSQLFMHPIQLNETVTIRARAFVPGFRASEVLDFEYIIITGFNISIEIDEEEEYYYPGYEEEYEYDSDEKDEDEYEYDSDEEESDEKPANDEDSDKDSDKDSDENESNDNDFNDNDFDEKESDENGSDNQNDYDSGCEDAENDNSDVGNEDVYDPADDTDSSEKEPDENDSDEKESEKDSKDSKDSDNQNVDEYDPNYKDAEEDDSDAGDENVYDPADEKSDNETDFEGQNVDGSVDV
jgi:hypothetical protein